MAITKFYLIRHGESMANEINVFIGQVDLDLTKKGLIQANKTAEFLKDIPVDKIYSSDLKRAYNTAKCTATLKNMKVTKLKGLREIYCGDWENKAFDYLEEKYPVEYGLWLKNIGRAVCINGESTIELKDRFISTLKNIADKNKDKTVFVFTHATPIRILKAEADKKSIDEICKVPWATNASVTYVEYTNNEFINLKYSMDNHLEGTKTCLPQNV